MFHAVSTFGGSTHEVSPNSATIVTTDADDTDRITAPTLRRERGMYYRSADPRHSRTRLCEAIPSGGSSFRFSLPRLNTISRSRRPVCPLRRRLRCRLSRKTEGREVQTWGTTSPSTLEWTSGARGAPTRGTGRREGTAEGKWTTRVPVRSVIEEASVKGFERLYDYGASFFYMSEDLPICPVRT